MKASFRLLVAVLCSLAAAEAAGEESVLHGSVVERAESGAFQRIVGANVRWLGTGTGTVSDSNGVFHIPFIGPGALLVVSCVGYFPDTVKISGPQPIRIVLRPDVRQVADVEVTGERPSTAIDYLDPRGVQVMTRRELIKAACCNLSESFETNPSVDVAFADAITGTRQIEMLGLAGIYAQITTENLPAIRGLTSNAGLTYIPGTWIDNIQVSKGVGSVANGYESITGQINVDLRKPENEQEKPLALNVFGNEELRLEANLQSRQRISPEWTSMTLLHMNSLRRPSDGNADGYLDMPLSKVFSLLQRFHYTNGERWEGQIAAQFVSDERDGGTLRSYAPASTGPATEYVFTTRSEQGRLSGKTGRIISADAQSSVGLQWSVSRYRQSAQIGSRRYDGEERTGYLNLLFDARIGSPDHRLRSGVSFLYDEFDEAFQGVQYARIERVPGLFAEYTYSLEEELAVVAGARLDHHNMFGTFASPRLHIRYSPDEDWVFRASAGRGQRTANVLAENMASLASSRTVEIAALGGPYPFTPEVGWNVGLNLTHYFLWDYRRGTISVDFYRTSFEKQVVVNLDRSPQLLRFENLAGRSFSNSAQVELRVLPLERLETNLAYRFLDVRQTLEGTLRERPFVARHRMLVNVAYSTERGNSDEPQMLYDATLQWFGQKRIPDTGSNPPEFRARQRSPEFAIVNAQITRSFFAGLDLYLGVENLLGFRQDDPILGGEDPTGPYFDSSLVWGPITGRMIYLGARWGL